MGLHPVLIPTAAVLPLNPAVVPLVRVVFESSHLDGTGGGTASGTSWYRKKLQTGVSGGSGGGSSRAVVPPNPAVLPPPGSFLLFLPLFQPPSCRPSFLLHLGHPLVYA